MTEPAGPAPEPEVKQRRLSRGWVIGIVAGVVSTLVLGGAAYGVKAKGDSQAETHAKALEKWAGQQQDMLRAPAEANRVLWDLYEDPTTKESLARQKKACEKVVHLQADVAEHASAVPRESDNFFKLLSSDERDAIKRSKARVKAVKAYAKAADEVLEQRHRDCVWNIKVNSVKEGDSGAKKIFDEAEKLKLKAGHSEGNYYCPSGKVDCIPVTAAKREKYAELVLEAIKVDKAYVMKEFFVAGQCDSTSYAELCVALKDNLSSFYGSLEDYSEIFAAVVPTNAKIKSELDAMKKSGKKADKAFGVAMFKAHPDFKADARLADDPFWQEAYFSATAKKAISELSELRDAVRGLSSAGADSVDALGPIASRRS